MKDSICAVYDIEDTYAYKMMNIMSTKKGFPFRPMIFTKQDIFMGFLKANVTNALLIHESLFNETIQKCDINHIFILTEDKPEDKAENETNNQTKNETRNQTGNETGDISYLYRYQPAAKILDEIVTECFQSISIATTKAKIFGVYSPVSNVGKTTFSLALANEIGEQYNTLYINFEEFSGLGELLVESNNNNLSDVAYNYRSSKEKLKSEFLSMIGKMGNFSYIAPVKCAEDLAFITMDNWLEIITYLADEFGYEAVVLDISTVLKQPWKMIQICEKAYLPVRSDYMSLKKENDFETYLLSVGKEEIYNRLIRLTIPYDKTLVAGPDFLNQLADSQYADYVREIANG